MSFYEDLKTMSTPKPKKKSQTTFVGNPPVDIDHITADELPLDFAKKYLRVDHDFDDMEIMVAIRTAQAYVRNYIKQPHEEPLDDGLTITILSLTAYFYEHKSPTMKSTEKLDVMFGSILDMYKREVL